MSTLIALKSQVSGEFEDQVTIDYNQKKNK